MSGGWGCEFCNRSATHSIWSHPVCDWSACEDRACEAGPPAGFSLEFTPAGRPSGSDGNGTES